ncbi:MAG: class II aldolase/adducin family protein [Chitinophagales bacterium]
MPVIDEGYIKYHIHWYSQFPIHPLFTETVDLLNIWRAEVYRRNWIGYDEKQKVGFGNISVRATAINDQLKESSKTFIISGTQTGHLPQLNLQHYSWVTSYNIAANELSCEGATKASSESLTHAAIYELNEDYQAVVHIHCKEMWLRLLHNVPTTTANIPYGTPKMAYEIQRLYRETDLADSKIVAMAGHEDGVIAFGKDLEEAVKVLLNC